MNTNKCTYLRQKDLSILYKINNTILYITFSEQVFVFWPKYLSYQPGLNPGIITKLVIIILILHLSVCVCVCVCVCVRAERSPEAI